MFYQRLKPTVTITVRLLIVVLIPVFQIIDLFFVCFVTFLRSYKKISFRTEEQQKFLPCSKKDIFNKLKKKTTEQNR